MSERATGRFDVTWDEDPPFDTASGATLASATVTKSFEGDLEGTSVARLVQARTDVLSSAGYVAIERVSGTLHGRSGSFVLQHSGAMTRGEGSLTVTVVPGSGTEELKGLSGSMRIDIIDGEHRYTFDYWLDGYD